MKWLAAGVFIGISALAGAQALAVVPASQASLNRRQLSDCMTKQMVASRTISYNEASRVCKDFIKSQAERLSASNQAMPAKAR